LQNIDEEEEDDDDEGEEEATQPGKKQKGGSALPSLVACAMVYTQSVNELAS
jgi:hypothetical protein